MPKVKYACMAMLMAAITNHPPSAFANTTDSELKQKLIGAWTSSKNDRTKAEELAVRLGIFLVENFDPDGEGSAIAYKGKMCGEVVRESEFSWSVVDGVLITTTYGKTNHDKIVSLTGDILELYSDEHQLPERRERTIPCPITNSSTETPNAALTRD